jgi:hypothetical protein
MKTGYMANVCLIILFVISMGGFAFAEDSLKDPGIPNGERSIYTLKFGDEQTRMVEVVTVEKEDGRDIYKIVSRSDFEDLEIKIVKNTMTVIYIRSVTESQGMITDKLTTLIEDGLVTEEDEIIVPDFSELRYVLRGFPFTDPRPLRIITLKTEEGGIGGIGNFKFTIKLLKTEEVELRNKSIDCYKLGLSLSGGGVLGLLKGLFPKTNFWFSVEAPHYLVRFEGLGGGGSKKTMELELEYIQ